LLQTGDDPRILSLDLGPNATKDQMEDSMNDSLKPNHFEGTQSPPPDQQIDLADVDANAFEFPSENRQSNNASKAVPGKDYEPILDPKLLGTADLIDQMYNPSGPQASAAASG
jgi:hypothetical protein